MMNFTRIRNCCLPFLILMAVSGSLFSQSVGSVENESLRTGALNKVRDFEVLLNSLCNDEFTVAEKEQVIKNAYDSGFRVFRNKDSKVASDLIPSKADIKDMLKDPVDKFLSDFILQYVCTGTNSIKFSDYVVHDVKQGDSYQFVNVFFKSTYNGHHKNIEGSYTPNYKVAELGFIEKGTGYAAEIRSVLIISKDKYLEAVKNAPVQKQAIPQQVFIDEKKNAEAEKLQKDKEEMARREEELRKKENDLKEKEKKLNEKEAAKHVSKPVSPVAPGRKVNKPEPIKHYFALGAGVAIPILQFGGSNLNDSKLNGFGKIGAGLGFDMAFRVARPLAVRLKIDWFLNSFNHENYIERSASSAFPITGITFEKGKESYSMFIAMAGLNLNFGSNIACFEIGALGGYSNIRPPAFTYNYIDNAAAIAITAKSESKSVSGFGYQATLAVRFKLTEALAARLGAIYNESYFPNLPGLTILDQRKSQPVVYRGVLPRVDLLITF